MTVEYEKKGEQFIFTKDGKTKTVPVQAIEAVMASLKCDEKQAVQYHAKHLWPDPGVHVPRPAAPPEDLEDEEEDEEEEGEYEPYTKAELKALPKADLVEIADNLDLLTSGKTMATLIEDIMEEEKKEEEEEEEGTTGDLYDRDVNRETEEKPYEKWDWSEIKAEVKDREYRGKKTKKVDLIKWLRQWDKKHPE